MTLTNAGFSFVYLIKVLHDAEDPPKKTSQLIRNIQEHLSA